MTPERWKRTEELFFAASAQPKGARAAFLDAACPDDESLRREVESLLNESESDRGFLAAAAVPAAVTPAAPTTLIGTALGPYQVQSLLGAGGMGEVYRARDSKLDRDVAIKILPGAFTSDPDRLARFEREARMLAALNHPNICAIYGVESFDGLRCLILELVEGQTLAELLVERASKGGLPLDTTIRLARQIAEALEAAHDKGIIHRDLKPANIKITADGLVKVLDFGLAKSVEGGGGSPDLTHAPTGGSRGIVLGTAAYMSPEQARGFPLDKRTDIWAYGCVLYQMLCGRVPFAGDTISDTVARILERDPDWSALPATTPQAVRRVVVRCLAKDHKQRLRDIGDVRIELNAIEDEAPVSVAPASGRQAAIGWTGWLTAAAVAIVAAAVMMWPSSRASTLDDPLAGATVTRLTNWDGAEEGAVVSPDGRFVAFLSDHEGEFDVWLAQPGTGYYANLTRDLPPLVPAGSIVRKLGFSGDGSELWFNPADRKPLLKMPLTGGVPRPFLPENTNTPVWSPAGDRLVWFGKPLYGADPMYMADGNAADAQVLYTPPVPMHSNNPVFSLDGQWIYFVSGSEPQNEVDVNVWRIRTSGGAAEQLTDQHPAANFLAPIDNRTVLYVAREEDGSGPWLWALDVDTRRKRRIAAGVDQFTSASSSRDGRRVVATIANPSASLWQAPLLDRMVEDRDTQPYELPAPTGRAWAPRFSRSSLFYLSARGNSEGLWKVQDNKASEVWRNVNGPLAEPPAVSPDGTRLAVVVRRDGKRHLSIMSADGTNIQTRALSIDIEGAAGQGTVDWSPDGASIITGGRDAGGEALFLIPAAGGDAVRLKEGRWVNPLWSPKGDVIVYAGRSNVGQVTLLAMRPDGSPIDMPQVWVRPGGYRFLPDGSGLVYIPLIHALDFWHLDFKTMKTRQLTRLGKHGTLKTFDITPDGKHIVFDRSRENSDLVLIDLPK